MEDGTVSVARRLLDNKVVVQRPPSGLRDKRNLALHYQKELSSTSLYKGQQLELFHKPVGAKEKNTRRVQSAKSRGDNDSHQGSDSESKPRRIRSAQPRLSGNTRKSVQKSGFKDLLSIENFELSYESSGSKTDKRPGSAKSCSSDTDTSLLKPSVYGLERSRSVFGSEPDLTSRDANNSFPFKFSAANPKSDLPQTEQRHSMAGDSSFSLKHNGRQIPKSLLPLVPWLQREVSADIIGIDGTQCLVFLPCLSTDKCDDLPSVPSLQHVDDELPYHEVVHKPAPPWKPKKYKHPSWNHVYEDFKNSDRRHSEIFSEDGHLLHVPQRSRRTADVIKREIKILEDLLKGIGTYEGRCTIAHYQADITNLQTMAGETLAKVNERPKTPEPPDLTGLRAFYKEHDEVITKIKLEHQLCMEELAKLEESGDAFVSYTNAAC